MSDRDLFDWFHVAFTLSCLGLTDVSYKRTEQAVDCSVNQVDMPNAVATQRALAGTRIR